MSQLGKNILLIRSVLGESQKEFGARFGATKAMNKKLIKEKISAARLALDELEKELDDKGISPAPTIRRRQNLRGGRMKNFDNYYKKKGIVK